MKMITLVNQKRKGFVVAMTLALFLSVVCSPSYAANNSLTEDYTSEQQNRITGTVTNTSGEPIPGANVFQKGTDFGTATGADGTFVLNAPANSVLEFTFIGYVTQEINIGTRTSVSVQLVEDVAAVGTAVITGFGNAQQQTTVTGAVSSIGADLIGRSTVSLASTALMGKVAGLNFRQSSGKPGQASGSSIKVRNMDGDPLYIIDGVESETEKFVNLNYYDIENVTVLKDASAAIYGSKAGNGVIIVTTKRGRLGEKPSVTLFAQYGWSNARPYFPEPANAGEYIYAKANSERLAGTAVNNLSYTKEEYNLWKEGATDEYKGYDWKKAMLQVAGQVHVKATVSGGSDNTNYYFSFGHVYEELHIYDPSQGEFNRTNGVINLDTRINKRLTVGVSASGSFKTDRNAYTPDGDNISYTGRLAIFKNWPMQNNYSIYANYDKFGKTYPRLINNWNTNPYNVWTYEDRGYNDDSRRDIRAGAYVDYTFMDNSAGKLNLRVDGSYYYNQRNQSYQYWPWYYYEWDPTIGTEGAIVGTQNGSHRRGYTTGYEEIYTSKAQLNYKGTFGNHNIAATFAGETYSRQSPGFSGTTNPTSKYSNAMTTAQFNSISFSRYNTNRRAGFLGNIHYDYAKKYLVELIGRYDGNYYYDKDERWGFFPAVSAGWRISEERFWKEGGINNILNDFKIRASWGKSGKNPSGTSAYDFLEGYTLDASGIIYDGNYVLGTNARGVAKFYSWQWVEDIDFGIDFAMFNGRLRGSVDYFEKKTDGIVASRGDLLTPSETGWDTPSENLNSDLRRGMDGSLTWTSAVGELGYSIGATFTYSRVYNWERYGASAYSSWNWYKSGNVKRFYNGEWGYQVAGQFKNWEEIGTHEIEIDDSGNSTLRPGDWYYKDLNNDGRIGGTGTGTQNNGASNYDIRVIQHPRTYNNYPNLNYGFNIALNWRGFDLSLQLTGAGGTSFWIYNELQFPFQNDGNILKDYANKQWRYDDPWADNPTLIAGKFPSLINGQSNWNVARYYVSDAWKVSSNYMKLKNAELGYSLPQAWLDKVNIKQARIAITGQNLLVFSSLYRDFGSDPEMSTDNGMDYNLPRTISVGLTLKF